MDAQDRRLLIVVLVFLGLLLAWATLDTVTIEPPVFVPALQLE